MVLASIILAAAAASEPGAVCHAPDGADLQLELAVTEKEKRTGLMFRDVLPADRGMLFPFDGDGTFSFHMRNTVIPLDIVWLDSSGRVADLHPDTRPCRSDPCPMYKNAKRARAVLLVNAGYSRAHAIVPGAQLRFDGVPGFPTGTATK